MKKADICYLQILSDYIHDRKTLFPTDFSMDILNTLVYYSRIQNTLGILWKQCGTLLSSVDKDLSEYVHHGFQNDIFRSVCLNTDFQSMCRILDSHQISYLPMKGIVLTSYYPDPYFRTMSDIDILIKKSDETLCKSILEEAGYTFSVGNPSVMVYTRDVVMYEFHTHMMYETLVKDYDYQSYFDHLWEHAKNDGNSYKYTIREEMHLLFLLTHLAKHIVNEGIGIRSFMDIAIILKTASLDFNYITSELKKIYLYDFACTVFTLCTIWFGIESPIICTLDPSFVDSVTHKVLTDGVFGKLNRENQFHRFAKTMEREKTSFIQANVRSMVRSLFPSYENMRYINWYSFLDGKPYLLPYAWMYRWYYVLTNKRRVGLKRITQPSQNKELIKKETDYFKKWGL